VCDVTSKDVGRVEFYQQEQWGLYTKPLTVAFLAMETSRLVASVLCLELK